MLRKFSLSFALLLVGSLFISSSLAQAATFNSSSDLTGLFSGSPSVNAKSEPYPSTITASGMTGVVTDVNVNVAISSVGEANFAQYDVMLMAPDGTATMLQSDCQAYDPVGANAFSLFFDQSAAIEMPSAGAIFTSGFNVVRPRNCASSNPSNTDLFPDLSPSLDLTADLGRFNGRAPNGNWSLYVGGAGPLGAFLNVTGWSIEISSAVPTDVTPPSFTNAAVTGSTVGFDLNEPATIQYRVERTSKGVRVKGRCLAKRRGRKGKACTRYVKLPGALTQLGVPGVNVFNWNGRLNNRRLTAGKYRLTAVATDAAGNQSPPQKFTVTIKKPKKKKKS